MTIALGNPSIFVVNAEFGFLILTDLATRRNGTLLGRIVAADPFSPASLYIPASVWIRDDMMCFWSFGHLLASLIS